MHLSRAEISFYPEWITMSRRCKNEERPCSIVNISPESAKVELTEERTCSIMSIGPWSAGVKLTKKTIYCYSAQNTSLSERIAKFTLTSVYWLGYFWFIFDLIYICFETSTRVFFLDISMNWNTVLVNVSSVQEKTFIITVVRQLLTPMV